MPPGCPGRSGPVHRGGILTASPTFVSAERGFTARPRILGEDRVQVEITPTPPGIGLLTIEAIQTRDYPVVQACVLLISLTYVLVNLLTDLAYAWIDPRIRLGAAA
mgnify:CR=1 FL=1